MSGTYINKAEQALFINLMIAHYKETIHWDYALKSLATAFWRPDEVGFHSVPASAILGTEEEASPEGHLKWIKNLIEKHSEIYLKRRNRRVRKS